MVGLLDHRNHDFIGIFFRKLYIQLINQFGGKMGIQWSK
jgi:hypothetical protein